MIESVLLGAPVAVAGAVLTRALLRRAPVVGVRWLVRVNATLAVAALLALVLMLAGVVDPAQAATTATSRSSGDAFIGAGIAVAGSTLGAGVAVSYTGSAALAAIAEKPEMLRSRAGDRWARRGDRDLRADRRHHPDREGMSAIAVIGERRARARSRSLASRVIVADGPDAARTAWRSLPADVGLVILSAAAHAALAPELAQRDRRLWVVMPK